jgi:ABC-2 type transport system permease protein
VSWWVLVRAGFARYAAYRAAMVGGALTNAVFGLLRASILTGAVAGTTAGTIRGWTSGEAVTYVWITQALIAPVHLFTWNELALRVRTGDIAVDLARPIDLQLAYGAADLGRAAAVVLPRSLPTLAVGAVTSGLTLPSRPAICGAAVVSVVLAVAVSFCCRYLVNLAAFWILDVRGVLTVYVTVSTLLAGLLVPVPWFPPWLTAIDRLTPFPAMLQTPADILVGRIAAPDLAAALAGQVAWLVALVAVGQLAQRLGARRLVVQGG